jgi:Flp pilus assembly protein TadD
VTTNNPHSTPLAEQAKGHFADGLALAQAGRMAAAAAAFERAIALAPDLAEAHFNRALALERSGDLTGAVVCARRAVELLPDWPEARSTLGAFLYKSGQLTAAVAEYREALRLRPHDADLQYALAAALAERNEPIEAIAWYRRVIGQRPDHVDAHLGLGIALLKTGQWSEGWREYEWRLRHPGLAWQAMDLPTWEGARMDSATVLLRAEQGLGDAMQFLRYAPLVKSRVGRVVVHCPPSLFALAARCDGVDEAVVVGHLLPPCHAQIPLLSLPRIFAAELDTIPSKIPYLHPARDAVEVRRSQLPVDGRLRVGIAWRGSPANPRDAVRSIPAAEFASLAEVSGVQLVNLQFGASPQELAAVGSTVIDFGRRLGDLHITAALVANLDLVITCDSAPAHLAGALGKPVWVALPWNADWRWLSDRDDSPWYPMMRLFRQREAGNWSEVLGRIAGELQQLVARRAD